jgi:hypothetical protein
MIARGTGYIRGPKDKARDRLAAHLRYLGRKSATTNDEGTEELFDAEHDQVDRSTALHGIMQYATSGQVRYHKIVLSPSASEHVTNWRAWTRGIMADLGRRLDANLHWYAIHHINTDNPHVHVVLAGSAEQRSDPENSVVVKMRLPEYEVLRVSGHAHSDAGWLNQLQNMAEQVARQETATPRRPFLDLLPGEGQVGTYKALFDAGRPGDNLTPHHIPSARYMRRHGVAYEQCIAVNVEQPDYGAGRHRLTPTYGLTEAQERNFRPPSQTPREELTRDALDLQKVYHTQGLDIVEPVKEVIRSNITAYPEVFRPTSPTPRQELAREVADFLKTYRTPELDIISPLRELIRVNMQTYPELFRKE